MCYLILVYSGIAWAPGHSSTGGWPRCHSPIWGQGLPMPNPLHLLWRAGLGYPVLLKFMGPTQGTFSLHSAFVGGELLPAAPLQPCAGAPSGRGHLFSGWVNLAPCNFSSNNVLLALQAWGTPSAWRHVPRPPIRWVSSGRWVLSEPCQYIPCPLLPTISSRVFSARHNIKCYFSIK